MVLQHFQYTAIDAGGHREIITNGENGILVADGSCELFGKAAAQLLRDDHLRERIVKSACVRARDFLPALHVERMIRLYTEVGSAR